MKKNITLQDLNDHYSGKKNLRENKRIFEDGTNLHKPYLGSPAIQSNKIDKIVAYFYDIELLPVTFQLDYIFNVKFNDRAISRDYAIDGADDMIDNDTSDSTTDREPSDAEIKNAKQYGDGDGYNASTNNSKNDETISLKDVNFNSFYHDYYTKKMPTYAVSKKIHTLIQTKQLDMGEFEIVALNYSQLDDKALFNQFSADYKNNMKNKTGVAQSTKKLPYGYSITIGAKDRKSPVNLTQCDDVSCKERKKYLTEFAGKFTEIFEKEILDRTRYWDFVKK